MNWFNRFLIFLLVVVVAVSMGLMVYYFLRNDETISVSSSLFMQNKGEAFDLTIERTAPRAETKIEVTSLNSNVVTLESSDLDNGVYHFRAIAGGETDIVIKTTNKTYSEITCRVQVGDGSKEFPYYVRNYDDLSAIGNPNSMIGNRSLNDNYIQVQDIDLSVKNANLWVPIGNDGDAGFAGTYNGNGHFIYNLKIIEPTASGLPGYPEEDVIISNAALFSKVASTGMVTRLNLSNVKIEGAYANVGAVAAVNMGTISYINVTEGDLKTSAAGSLLGGVVAANAYGAGVPRLDRVSYDGKLTGATTVGGIAGQNQGGLISNSYSRGVINAGETQQTGAGGIVGHNQSLAFGSGESATVYKANIVNSYTTVTNNSNASFAYKGAVIGRNVNPNGNSVLLNNPNENRIIGVYYVSALCGINNAIGGTDDSSDYYFASNVTQEALKTVPTDIVVGELSHKESTYAFISHDAIGGGYVKWNFSDVWNLPNSNVNDGFPTLRMEGKDVVVNVYDVDTTGELPITTESQLRRIADKLDGEYVIDGNISLSEEWVPLGTEENPFTGKLTVNKNGDSYYKISNMKINSFYTYAGFFGYVGAGAQIDGLTLQSVEITAGKYVGAIAGYNAGLISNSSVSGTNLPADTSSILCSNGFDTFMGGIAGFNSTTGTVDKVRVGIPLVASVGNNTWNIGGIVGQNQGYVSNAEFTASVQANKSAGVSATRVNAGGIAGYNTNSITKSKVMGDVVLEREYDTLIAGGLVGMNTGSGKITFSSATGKVNGYWAGGLVGYNNGSSSGTNNIDQCYVGNSTIQGAKIGGLVGRMQLGRISNCYTLASLSGDIMGGFAATIELSNQDTYATVEYCFSAAQFDRAAGKAYCETSSEVRAVNFVFAPNSTKVAGYVNSCIYDADNASGAERRYSSWRLGSIQLQSPDDGRKSSNDCKKMSTFSNRGFSSSYWECVDGEYPTLINAR